MALELKATLPLAGNKTDAWFEVNHENRSQILTGDVDIVSDVLTLSMAGRGVVLGQYVQLLSDDYAGDSSITQGSISRWQITDDGVAPPAVLKFTGLGDSHTDKGSSGTTDGSRPSNESVSLYGNGFWVAAAYLYADSDYIFRPDLGQSSTTTTAILARIETIKLYDADLLTLMIGTNDIGESGAGVETAKANYTTIVNELRLNDNFKVIIVPVPYRNNFVDNTAANLSYDELNAHCANIAAITDGVEIVPVNTAVNVAMMTDQVTYGGVSNDGLHLNDTGSFMTAEPLAAVMDSLFPSTIEEKFNLAPAEFTGTGGNLGNGATGIVPDGYSIWYANNTTENGCDYVDRGDGKQWVKIRTNGGAPVSNNNRFRFILGDVACTEGWYVGEMTIEVSNPEVVSVLRLAAGDTGATYNYSDNAILSTAEPNTYMDGSRVFKLRSPTARFENGFGYVYLDFIQNLGVDSVVYITDVKLYKVEEL